MGILFSIGLFIMCYIFLISKWDSVIDIFWFLDFLMKYLRTSLHFCMKKSTELKSLFAYLKIWSCQATCRILFSWQRIKPTLMDMTALSPNHWTARELPEPDFFFFFNLTQFCLKGLGKITLISVFLNVCHLWNLVPSV